MIYIFNAGGGSADSDVTGVVSNIHTLPSETSIKIWWDDPDDRYWGKTVLVRKEGSSPESPEDGEILTESTVRDQYKYSSDAGPCYEDTGLLDDKTYYYALFPYSRKGNPTIDEAEKFNAKTVKMLTVTFMNGQEVWDTVKVIKGHSAVCSKGNPSKASDETYDYTFIGWASTDGKESQEAGILDNILEDKTVYAAYSKAYRTFTVTFMNGSVVWDTVSVPYGGTASTSKGNPSKASDDNYDYSFAGWASADGKESAESGILDNITSSKIVYAAYSKTRNKFTVTFMNGGAVWDTVTVKKGTTAVCSKGNPTKAQTAQYTYSFVGWASSDEQESAETRILENIQEDKTVYAAYSKTVRIYTVTFMNGSSVYDTVKVQYGGTASCSKGNPTKTQTAQYTYSFVGWASYDGATSASSTILQNITSDKTVYAAFSSSTRKYTITWKDWDGTTLKTDQVAYGSTPSYSGTPSFGGWEFTGWNPTPKSVTGAATYYATYTLPTGMTETITKDWDTIIANAKSGTTSGYSTGATKIMVLTDKTPLCMELAGIKTTTGATFDWISRTIAGRTAWNNSDSNTNGYPSSDYKTYLEGTILAKFPSNIKNALKSVTKYCFCMSPKNANLSYTAKVWPPNVREMNYDTNYETKGPCYSYYDSISKHLRYDGSGTATFAWLSSTQDGYSSYVMEIYFDGSCMSDHCDKTFGALPCFCL